MSKFLKKILNYNSIEVPLGTEISGKEHYWSKLNLKKNEFYTLPGYVGQFKLIESKEMGYSGYIEHLFIKEIPKRKSNIKNLTSITEKEINPKIISGKQILNEMSRILREYKPLYL